MAAQSEDGTNQVVHSSVGPVRVVVDGLSGSSEPREEAPKNVTDSSRSALTLQLWATIVTCFGCFISGTAVGWTSPVLYNMRKTGKPMNMTDEEASLMVSLFYAGNIVAPIPSGLMADWCGRKGSLLILSILPTASWLMTYFAKSPPLLHVSRFLIGMWTGVAFTVSPLFVAEVVAPHYRGRFMGIISIMTNVGALFPLLFGPKLSYETFTIVLLMFPALFVILMLTIPESPIWYVRKNYLQSASKSLQWYRWKNTSVEVEEELNVIIETVDSTRNIKMLRAIIDSKGNRTALIIVQVLSLLQRFSGVSAIVAFGALTLPERDIWFIPFTDLMFVVVLLWFFAVLLNPFIVDRFGRKPLLVMSSVGTGISSLLLASWFYHHQSSTDYVLYWAPFALFVSFGLFFNLGLGPLVPTLQGEMFPPHLKGVASGLSSVLTAVGSAFTCWIYLPIADSAGMYVNFIIYTIMCCIASIFSWLYVVETRGKSLYQIQADLKKFDKKIVRFLSTASRNE